MITPEKFEKIVSGQDFSCSASLLRTLFSGVEIPYFLLTSLRNHFYNAGIFRTAKIPVPVISVGNLTLGGTGKTPVVEWLIRILRKWGFNPGVASRGYRADKTGWNDESRELDFFFPGIPQAISPNRVLECGKLLEYSKSIGNPVDIVILDDGFQHRKLYRNLDIVLIDALLPFGYGRIFPRGLLRESVNALRRADVAILTKGDLVSEEVSEEIRKKIFSINPQLTWSIIKQVPVSFLSYMGKTCSIDEMSGKKVGVFSGIGNPKGFLCTLKNLNLDVRIVKRFSDHHHYSEAEIFDFVQKCRGCNCDTIVCTIKDLVKLKFLRDQDIPLFALSITVDCLHGETPFFQKLRNVFTE